MSSSIYLLPGLPIPSDTFRGWTQLPSFGDVLDWWTSPDGESFWKRTAYDTTLRVKGWTIVWTEDEAIWVPDMDQRGIWYIYKFMKSEDDPEHEIWRFKITFEGNTMTKKRLTIWEGCYDECDRFDCRPISLGCSPIEFFKIDDIIVIELKDGTKFQFHAADVARYSSRYETIEGF